MVVPVTLAIIRTVEQNAAVALIAEDAGNVVHLVNWKANMATREELLETVTRLERMWLSDWAVEILHSRQKHITPEAALKLLEDHIQNPANQYLAKQQFAAFRAQIEKEFPGMGALEVLPEAVQTPAK